MDVSRFLSSRRPKPEPSSFVSTRLSDDEETIVVDNYDPEDADFGTDFNTKSTDAVDRQHYGEQLVRESKQRSFAKMALDSSYDGVKTSRSTMGYTERSDSESAAFLDESDDMSVEFSLEEEAEEGSNVSFDFSDKDGASTRRELQSKTKLKEDLQDLDLEEDHLKMVSDRRVKDRQRGASVRRQFSIFKSLVDVRMAMQPLMQMLEEVSDDDMMFDAEIVEETERLCEMLVDAFGASVKATLPTKSLKSLDLMASDIWKTSLDTWHQKALLSDVHLKRQQSSNKRNSSASVAFKVIDQGPAAQVELAMRDKDRLVHRTKMRRLCPNACAEDAKPQGDIFDDADFYRILIKEAVGQSIENTVSLKATQMSNKSSAAVSDETPISRGPSKGKRLRYDVHEKLVSFMAPLGLDHPGMWSSERIDAFFSSVFS